MSGLRDGLGEWALGRGDEVAAQLLPGEAATRGAIRTRRRRRAGAIAGGALATILGVAAIASALPGTTAVQPADNPLQDISSFNCGDDWTLQAGETNYEPGADYYFDSPVGYWTLTDDDGDTHTGFSGFTAGLGGMSWQGSMQFKGVTTPKATVVAVQQGKIVGAFQGDFARNFSFDGSRLEAFAPYPGQCGDLTAVANSGKYTYHLVIQVVEVGWEGKTLATIVDPSGPYTVDIDGLEQWGEAAAVPTAELREPQGDTYQAFLVRPTGQGACRPLQEAREDGTPSAASLQYTVSLPGVQPLTSGMWAGDPVMVLDKPLQGEWYANQMAWLVADDVGAMQEPYVVWSEDGKQLASSLEWISPIGAGNCAFETRLDPVEGAVFLVIWNVDWPAFIEQNPGADLTSMTGYTTWVYLGQAH